MVPHCLSFSVATCLTPHLGSAAASHLPGCLFLEETGAWAEDSADPTSEQTGLVKFPAKRRPGFPCSDSPPLQGVRTVEVDKGHTLEAQVWGRLRFENPDPSQAQLIAGEQSWSLRTFQGSSRMLLRAAAPQAGGGVAPDKMQTLQTGAPPPQMEDRGRWTQLPSASSLRTNSRKSLPARAHSCLLAASWCQELSAE